VPHFNIAAQDRIYYEVVACKYWGNLKTISCVLLPVIPACVGSDGGEWPCKIFY